MTDDAAKLLLRLAEHDSISKVHLHRVARTIQDLDLDIDAHKRIAVEAVAKAARLHQPLHAPVRAGREAVRPST